MDKFSEVPSTKYSLEELILFAGVSFNTITNAIDNGEMEIMDNIPSQPQQTNLQ
jgi:hypothetical protein